MPRPIGIFYPVSVQSALCTETGGSGRSNTGDARFSGILRLSYDRRREATFVQTRLLSHP